MSYIGNTNTTQGFTPAIDYFSGNASTTAFTLSRPVASAAQVQAVVNNVAQNPSDAFTVSGNTITFTSAPSSGTNNIYVYYTSPITQVIAPSQGTVGTTQLSATGTPSSSNFLRGDNAWSGVAATDITTGTFAKARLPAGSVLQVVQTVKTNTFTTASLSPTDVTGMSVSITPTSATSKVLIMFYVGLVGNTTSGQGTELWLLRDSTQLNTGDADGARTRVTAAQINGGTNYDSSPVAIVFLDSPATTSATTYKIQLATQDAGTAVFNRRGDDASSSASYQRSGASIIVMEIAA
jgi:hypothetical protein